MEEENTEPPTQSSDDQNDDVFHDALDHFPPSPDQPDHSTSSSSSSTLDHPDSKPPPATNLPLRPPTGDDSKPSSLDSSTDPNPDSRPTFRARRFRLPRNLKPPEPTQAPTDSTVTTAADDVTRPGDDSADSADQLGDSDSNALVFLAGLVIKAIGVQISLIVRILSFPVWVLYNFYMLVVDPLQIVQKCQAFFTTKASNLGALAGGWVSPVFGELLRDKDSVWKVALRFGWGFLWAVYVGTILCGLLVASLVCSGVFMRYIVAEPLRMKEMLNFDYTKHSPVAYVPVESCAGVECGMDCNEKVRDGGIFGFRVIPPGHKLKATVSFVLPESEYNRNLGIFQVRVALLSAEGKTLASSSHPCMLRFKSEPIRLLLTFLKIAPLISGYVSETQTLNMKLQGFTESDVPTACLKVTIEQRAEFRPGAGIPEIYDASITLESELPLWRRIIWYWKKTIFVWISMMLFMMEMLFTLVCCRPLIIPRARPRTAALNSRSTQNQSSLPVRN